MKSRLLIISLVFFGLIGTVHAVPELDPTLAFDYSETVVIGKILSVDILSEPQTTRTENYYSEVSGIALYEVEIDEYLKNSSEDNIITVPGLFLREPHAMAYETYPYEIGQQVLLYLQENTHGYADTKLIIRSGDSKVIENELCDLGHYFDKGQCMKIDDSTKTPEPPCKSVPRPDGEGWDCRRGGDSTGVFSKVIELPESVEPTPTNEELAKASILCIGGYKQSGSECVPDDTLTISYGHQWILKIILIIAILIAIPLGVILGVKVWRKRK